MKKYLATLSAMALIGMAPHVLAASSTDLSVTGKITPNACTLSLSGGGMIDIGKFSAADLALHVNTEISRDPLQLTMACDGSTPFALRSIDNKHGTESTSGWFGLGLSNAGEKLGFVYVGIKQTSADGQAAQAIKSEDEGVSWTKGTSLNKTVLVSAGTAADQQTPIMVKDLTMDLEVSTFIAPSKTLTLTDETILDASATIEVVYR